MVETEVGPVDDGTSETEVNFRDPGHSQLPTGSHMNCRPRHIRHHAGRCWAPGHSR